MCYQHAEQFMIKAEEKWVAAAMEIDGIDEETAWQKYSDWWEAFKGQYPEACCHDVIVAIQDDTERMTCTRPA